MNSEQQQIYNQIIALNSRITALIAAAEGLEAEADQLLNCIDPVIVQHTVDTWDGQAATGSRNKLDDYGGTAQTVRTTFNNMAEIMRNRAAGYRTRVSGLWVDYSAAADPVTVPANVN